jgi:hypothetical protein
VLQLQGDQRVAVKNFLVSFGIVTEKEAKDSIVMYVWRCTFSAPP